MLDDGVQNTGYTVNYLSGLDMIGQELTGQRGDETFYEGKWDTFAHDLTGNVRGLMDSSGLAAHTDYTPYGERITTGPGHARTSPGYHGEMTDGNGMVYMRARTYDPRLSQFLQRDPMLGAHPTLPASWNPYALAHGNPVNLTDPTGEFVPIVLGALAFVGVSALSVGSVYAAHNIFVTQGVGRGGHNQWQWDKINWTYAGVRFGQGSLVGAELGASFLAGHALSLLAPVTLSANNRLLASASPRAIRFLENKLTGIGVRAAADISWGVFVDTAVYKDSFGRATTTNAVAFLLPEALDHALARPMKLWYQSRSEALIREAGKVLG
ncbi:MAG: RHS repeat-associated core domain-containing protein, partial [Chloroflexota bacterium]